MKLFKSILFLLCILGVLAPTTYSFAAQSSEKRPKKLDAYPSEELAKEIKKITDAITGEQYRSARSIIDRLLRSDKIEPISYDTALLNSMKAHTFLRENKFKDAIPPLQKAYDLGVEYNLWSERELQNMLLLIAQSNYQLGSETKNLAQQKEYYQKAIDIIESWFAKGNPLTSAVLTFASTAYYQMATVDPKNIDKDMLRKTIDIAWKNLTRELKIDEKVYQLIVAALFNMEDVEKTSEILEILVASNPDKKETWEQLLALYNAIAGKAIEANDPVEAKRNQLRMALTMERAQKHNILSSKKDNLTLVAIYFQLEEFDHAAQLLEQFIKENKLEDIKGAYDLLSSAYFRLNEPERSIEALKRSAAIHQDNGEIEFTIAQFYLSLDDQKNAYNHLLKALEKGKVEKPGALKLMLAYTSYELGNYDESLKWAKESLDSADTEKRNARRMVRAAQDRIYAVAMEVYDKESTVDNSPAPALKMLEKSVVLERFDDALRWGRDALRHTYGEEKEVKRIEKIITETAQKAYESYPQKIEETSVDREKVTLRFSMARACIALKKFDEAIKWAEASTPFITHPSQERARDTLITQINRAQKSELDEQEKARMRAIEEQRMKESSK